MDKINLLQLFVSLAEQGSFVAVANQSGQSPSTISKAITRLEKDLGVRLLHRTTRQLQLTEAGESYLQTAREVLSLLQNTESKLTQNISTPTGTLKINLPMSFGQLYVVPLLPEFCQQYPDIKLELSFSDDYTDIVESGIDIAIRSGKLNDSRLIARRICPMDMGIFASPDHLAKFGTPTTPAEFEQHNWIKYRFKQSGRILTIMLPQAEQIVELDPKSYVLVDDGNALAQLTSRGTGLAFMPHFLVRDLVQEGKLTLISSPWRNPEQAVYLYYLSRDYLPAKVRLFIEYIVQKLASQGESAHASWMKT